jgi:hypothetical protein
MTVSAYPLPVTVIEPGDGDPATRLMGRVTRGTAHGRAIGCRNVVVSLNMGDYKLYKQANPSISDAVVTLCDGEDVRCLAMDGTSTVSSVDAAGEICQFPLMSDGQYLSALHLVPGMYVVRKGNLTPRQLTNNSLTVGLLRVGVHRYDSKGRALKRKAPAILYAWDEAAMEAKDEAGQLTDMEKALFASIIQYQRNTALVETARRSVNDRFRTARQRHFRPCHVARLQEPVSDGRSSCHCRPAA